MTAKRIVGINVGTDQWGRLVDAGGCALIEGYEIVGAIAEERVQRRKHAGGFAASLPYLLDLAGWNPESVDSVWASWYGTTMPVPRMALDAVRADLPTVLQSRLRAVPSHHLSHAYCSFFLSPFPDSAVIVADNEGSLIGTYSRCPPTFAGVWSERNSYFLGRGNDMSLLCRDLDAPGELGWGRAYARMTAYVGLGDYHSAGKLQGLSAYGRFEPWMDELDIWQLDNFGRVHSLVHDRGRLEDVVSLLDVADAPPPADPFQADGLAASPYAQLALYIQYQLTKSMALKALWLTRSTEATAVCLGGGVALNSSANSALERILGMPVYAPPYPSDEGQALGNAIYGCLVERTKAVDEPPIRFADYVYLGTAVTKVGVDDPPGWQRVTEGTEGYLEAAAQSIVAGSLIGWVHGRSEYGARALGHRSILASPVDPAMVARLNQTKGREAFRPVAPAVRDRDAETYFDDICSSPLAPLMQGVYRAKLVTRRVAPAAVHVDGSSRVQIVRERSTPALYGLLTVLERLGHVPIVINTSFNRAGEPIVEDTRQALTAAQAMGLDMLCVGDQLWRRTLDRSSH